MQYKVQLTDEKVKPHQVIALHLITGFTFLAAGSTVFVFNFAIKWWGAGLAATGGALLLLCLAKSRQILKKPISQMLRIAELAPCVVLTVYFSLEGWKFPAAIFALLSLALAFALFWERSGSRKQYVLMDESGVRLPVSLRGRLVGWPEVELVLLRFGTLSLECTDNRRYQWGVDDTGLDGSELEQYCQMLIQANIGNRQKSSW